MNAAAAYIRDTIALQTDDEIAESLRRIKRRFDVVSTIRAFEKTGYDSEFEIRQYMAIVRSRKSKPETKRRALEALRSIRGNADVFEPDAKDGAPTRGDGTKADRTRSEKFGAGWKQEVEEFSG